VFRNDQPNPGLAGLPNGDPRVEEPSAKSLAVARSRAQVTAAAQPLLPREAMTSARR
jgi:hypothetical protein